MGLWTKLFGGAEDEKTKRQPTKPVLPADKLCLALSDVCLRAGHDSFQKCENNGLLAPLSSQQQARLALELLLFELVCKTLSLARFYGDEGYKASTLLHCFTLTAFAENYLQVEKVSAYTEAALVQLDSHFQYYAQFGVLFVIVTKSLNEETPPTGNSAISAGTEPVLSALFSLSTPTVATYRR